MPPLRRCAVLALALLAAPLGAQSLITGTDDSPGTPAHLQQFAAATLAVERSFLPYGTFAGGVRVASGDVDNDGIDDLVTGSGPGASHVKVFSGATSAEIRSFTAIAGFTGGVFVAAGDVDNDGFSDVVVGADTGGAPHVKVFSGATGAEIRNFLGYDPTFAGGVRVAAGDHDGDGFADIVTGAGPGAGPHVKVFSGSSGAEIRSFFAYDPAFAGGVYVASAEFNGDALAEIVTGAGSGAQPHVKVFNGADISEIGSFFAFDPAFSGGVRVGAGSLDGLAGADIVAGSGPGPGGGSVVNLFSGPGTSPIGSFLPYGAGYDDGVFVAPTGAPAGPPPPPPPSVLEVPTLGTRGAIAFAALLALLAIARLRPRLSRARIRR